MLQGLEQMPFDHQIRGMRWRGDGVCCFILAGSGGIDAFRASRVLPHLLHLSTLSAGHLSQADLSGFRACVLLADLLEWPATEENAPDLLTACKELASNGSAVAVVAVFLSPIPGGPDRDASSTASLQNAVLGAGADCVLFSCPTHPVTFRHLQTAVQGTEAWHERIAEAIESAQAKLARAQEQRWQRHYQIALRKIVWKAPQTVFPHIPQEDADLDEREDGVGDCSFVRVIGSGAFGSVFLGRHPRLGDVAVKAIKKASIKNIFDLAKVERELSILMGVLDHPNVLQILSCLHSARLGCWSGPLKPRCRMLQDAEASPPPTPAPAACLRFSNSCDEAQEQPLHSHGVSWRVHSPHLFAATAIGIGPERGHAAVSGGTGPGCEPVRGCW